MSGWRGSTPGKAQNTLVIAAGQTVDRNLIAAQFQGADNVRKMLPAECQICCGDICLSVVRLPAPLFKGQIFDRAFQIVYRPLMTFELDIGGGDIPGLNIRQVFCAVCQLCQCLRCLPADIIKQQVIQLPLTFGAAASGGGDQAVFQCGGQVIKRELFSADLALCQDIFQRQPVVIQAVGGKLVFAVSGQVTALRLPRCDPAGNTFRVNYPVAVGAAECGLIEL